MSETLEESITRLANEAKDLKDRHMNLTAMKARAEKRVTNLTTRLDQCATDCADKEAERDAKLAELRAAS